MRYRKLTKVKGECSNISQRRGGTKTKYTQNAFSSRRINFYLFPFRMLLFIQSEIEGNLYI